MQWLDELLARSENLIVLLSWHYLEAYLQAVEWCFFLLQNNWEKVTGSVKALGVTIFELIGTAALNIWLYQQHLAVPLFAVPDWSSVTASASVYPLSVLF